ncbi:MAG: universal stress protein [Myxococcota bacterium]
MSDGVLVAWDPSAAADRALAWAARYVSERGGKLVVAHVMVPAVPMAFEIGPVPISDAQIEAVKQLIREAAAKHGAAAQPEVMVAMSIAGGVVRAAEEHAAALVCVGHGRGALASFVLGSVAQEVVRSCPVPVVVCRG